MAHDDQNHNPFQGMPFIPMSEEQYAEFMAEHMKEHEMQKAELDAFQMEKTAFLGGLSSDQLVMLRKIIAACGASNEASAYMAGEIGALLKYVHKVDPNTGQDPFAQLLTSGGHEH